MGDDSEIEGYGRRTPELSSAALRKKHDTTNIEKKTETSILDSDLDVDLPSRKLLGDRLVRAA